MSLSASTKRSVRSVFHTLLALLAISPVLLSQVGSTEKGASIVAAVAVVSKLVNTLEDAGIIPAWLKDSAAPEGDAAP